MSLSISRAELAALETKFGRGTSSPILPFTNSPTIGPSSPQPPQPGSSNSASQVRTSNFDPEIQKLPDPTKELYFCVDKLGQQTMETRFCFLGHPESTEDDAAFYQRAQLAFKRIHGSWVHRAVSWITYTKVVPVTFHFLFNDDDLVRVFPLAENSGWPTPLCQGYEYRVPADITLGVFIQILATTILCGINEPSLGKGQRTVVDGFPKRGAPPGLDKKALTAGLGFHVSRGFSLKKIAIWMFSLAIVGFLFVPAWLALVDKHDLQNAFTPFTILYIPCGIALAIIPQLL